MQSRHQSSVASHLEQTGKHTRKNKAQTTLFSRITHYLIIILAAITVIRSLYIMQTTETQVPLPHSNEIKNISRFVNYNAQNKINFQQYLHNVLTDEHIDCSSSNFKYINLLMKDIYKYNNTFTFKWNSSSLSTALIRESNNKTFIQKQYILRLKYINNTLYHTPYAIVRNYAKLYVKSFILYFWKFTQKYKHSLPAFDIVIYHMDDLKYHYNFVSDYTRIAPVFVSESYKDNHTNVLFHSISRGMVKNWYTKVLRFASAANNSTNPNSSPTEYRLYKYVTFDTKLNQVLFRGTLTNKLRDAIIYELNYVNSAYNISPTFIDAKLVKEHRCCSFKAKCDPHSEKTKKCWTEKMSEADQEMYKFIMIIDGHTTRDGLVLQMVYNSVKLKHKSNLYSFWYYDLIDKENILLWNTKQELMHLINDLYENKIENLEEIALNSVQYAIEHFNEKSLDCFTLNMINIYNQFFFNQTAVELDQNDRIIDESKMRDYISFENPELINMNVFLNTTMHVF